MSERYEHGGHVFISYVREDTGRVVQLQQRLESAGIRVWRDASSLWPGQNWREMIKRAITDDTLIFLACFSSQSVKREKSYQREELTLAIDQLRLRPPGLPWLIPIRFDDCAIPNYDIGGGRALDSIQHADLFGDRLEKESERLIKVVIKILSPHSVSSSASWRAGGQQSRPANRQTADEPIRHIQSGELQSGERLGSQWERTAASPRGRPRLPPPPRVVAHFTGRDDLMGHLHEALSAERPEVIIEIISGLAGVGKTQLAAAYVQDHYREYDIVAWVRDGDGWIKDLADLAKDLRLPVKRRNPRQLAGDVLVFLYNTDRRWLLVLDDAPGPEALPQLPSLGHGRVLVTSQRRGVWGDFGAEELVVDEFDPGAARRYLLARSGRTDQEADDADAVAAALGYLPLALAQAGAYCAADFGVSFGEYLERLQALLSQELFNTNPAGFYEKTIAATWDTSITAAERQAPLARQALEMTAYLAPETIPRSFFSVLDDSSVAGRARVDNALGALHGYSLATRTGDRISVHRLLQKVIRDRLSGKEQEGAISHALTAVQASMPSDPQLPQAWPRWQELVPHAAALVGIDPVANLNAAQLVRILNPMCLFLLSAGFIQSPEKSPIKSGVALRTHTSRAQTRSMLARSVFPDLVTKAVDVATRHLGDAHPDTLTARANLARWTGEAGAAVRARDQFAELVDIEQQKLGPKHPRTLADRESLARWTGEAGDPAGARDQLAKLLRVRRKDPGPKDPGTLATRSNLAYWTGKAGNAAKARKQVAALLRVRRVLGEDHPHTLADRSSLARWTGDAGNPVSARDQFAELLKVEERVLGPEHPDTLATRGSLAYWTGEAGDPSGARDQLAELLPVREEVLGAKHPDTLVTRYSLAHWTGDAGDPSGARDQLAELVPVRRRVLGEEHPDTLATCDGLAHWTGEAGDPSGARDQFAALLPVRRRVLGEEHPDTLATRGALAHWTGEAGAPSGARDQLAELLKVEEGVLGPKHPSTLATRKNLARWTGDAGDPAGAREQFAALLSVQRRVLGEEHPDTLATRGALAHWTGEAGDPSGARDQLAALLEVEEVEEGVFGPEHPSTLATRENLARWTGNAGEAAGARRRFAELLRVRRGILRAEHPDILATRGGLAHWTGEAGNPAGARNQLTALLRREERVLGPEHPGTLATRENLARWTGDAGDPAGARDQFAALLEVEEGVFGPEHPSTLATRGGLAHWTGEAGDPSGARDQFAALLSVQRRVLGKEHPSTLATRENLARWTGNAGDAAGARNQFAELLRIRRRVLGPEHPHILATRRGLYYWTRELAARRESED